MPASPWSIQERSLVGALSVAENVYAGRQPVNAFGVIRRGPMYEGTGASWPISRSTSTRARRSTQLSPGQQQMVEIAKGLSHELKLLILDEPTSSLTINEGRHLFRVIRRLAAQGVADHLRLAPHGRDLRDLRPRDGAEGRPRDRRARDSIASRTAS